MIFSLLQDEDENDDEEENGDVEQRPIGETDVCPICQEEFLLKKLPITFCRSVKIFSLKSSSKSLKKPFLFFSTDTDVEIMFMLNV